MSVPVVSLNLRNLELKLGEVQTQFNNIGSFSPLHEELEAIRTKISEHITAVDKSKHCDDTDDAIEALRGKVDLLLGECTRSINMNNSVGAKLETVRKQLASINGSLNKNEQTNEENRQVYLKSLSVPKPKPKSWCSIGCVAAAIPVVAACAIVFIAWQYKYNAFCHDHLDLENSAWSFTACLPFGPQIYNGGISAVSFMQNATVVIGKTAGTFINSTSPYHQLKSLLNN